jgi:hypothetical protein
MRLRFCELRGRCCTSASSECGTFHATALAARAIREAISCHIRPSTISTSCAPCRPRACKGAHQFDELEDPALSDEKERSGQDGLEQLGPDSSIEPCFAARKGSGQPACETPSI